MAVKLRLRRMGRKQRPIYAIVAADTRSPRDGRFIEDLGRYRPLDEPATVSLQDDRVLYWLSTGAQPTETVRSILSREGLMLGLHLQRKGKSPEEVQEAIEAHRAQRAEQDGMERKLTKKDRQQQALEAEEAAAKERDAEARKAAEEARKKAEAEAEEARKKAEAEREAAAATARAEQEAANAAQSAEDAEPVVEGDETPANEAAETPTGDAEAGADEAAEESTEEKEG